VSKAEEVVQQEIRRLVHHMTGVYAYHRVYAVSLAWKAVNRGVKLPYGTTYLVVNPFVDDFEVLFPLLGCLLNVVEASEVTVGGVEFGVEQALGVGAGIFHLAVFARDKTMLQSSC
jgi:hypothetical protein